MKIITTVEIDAPASTVWEFFGERFADVNEWADQILDSSLQGTLGQGAIRTCNLKGFGSLPPGKVTEQITHFNRDKYELTYVITSGIPTPMTYIDNAWFIEPLSAECCLVTSRANFVLKWWMLPMAPIMRFPIAKAVKGFAAELKNSVETQQDS